MSDALFFFLSLAIAFTIGCGVGFITCDTVRWRKRGRHE
jgi:hypothetical protein